MNIQETLITFFASTCIALIGFTAINVILGTVSINVLFFEISLALACLFPFLQLFWFSDAKVKSMPYIRRVICFLATYLPVLVLAALVGKWFNSTPTSWGIFLAIYLAIGVVISLAFYCVYRGKTAVYEKKLAEYKTSK